MKPFRHVLPAKLAQSSDSNVFQAISLISEQYKHHYEFRSLTETGNAITILTAGNSFYCIDESNYKMAKSYVYLTNVSCVMVNLSRPSHPKVKADIIRPNKKPQFTAESKLKIEQL